MKTLTVLPAIFFATITFGQIKTSEITRSNGLTISKADKTDVCLCCNKNSNMSKPIYLINGKETALNSFDTINPSNIESVSVYKDAKAAEKLGKPAPNGLIEIKTKKAVELLSFEDLATKYKFDPKLNIVVGKQLVADKNEILIDESMITKVETLSESPFVEPYIPHLPGEKMVYIAINQ